MTAGGEPEPVRQYWDRLPAGQEREIAVDSGPLETGGRTRVSIRIVLSAGALGTNRVLVIETEGGEHDRIALDGAARRLDLDGPAGKTGIVLDAAGARVVSASCRHATCRRQGAVSRPGELIACAPNRLVLRVETA